MSHTSSTTAKAHSQPGDIRQTVLHYIGQLTEGCGVWSCDNNVCDTGRRNTAAPNRPVRKYTPRSARAIAIALASGPSPLKHICPLYIHSNSSSQVSNGEDASVIVQDEGSHDPSSFSQLHSNTRSIRQFCASPHASKTQPGKHQDLLKKLQSIVGSTPTCVTSPPRKLASNQQVASIIVKCINALFEAIPTASPAQYEYADSFIRDGSAFPSKKTSAPVDAEWNRWLLILDKMDSRLELKLLSTMCQTFALRIQLEADLDEARRKVGGRSNFTPLADILELELREYHECGMVLAPWCKRVFLMHWDGISTSISRGSVACGALECIHFLHQRFSGSKAYCTLPAVAKSLDAVEMAETWMKLDNSGARQHLLSFDFLFTAPQRAMYFRTLCHLRMRQAVSLSEQAAAMRRRLVPHMLDEEPEGRLKYVEEQYLLLNVSRTNVLQDTFDQIWQRQQGELTRPLRVRLGEVDDLEVGHDLGGVQIEFFNLVCREVWKEETGMFTTNLQTGLAFFRPGSLQPLFMFELLGLLFALAMHNGITLPVSLPLVFYKVLGSEAGELEGGDPRHNSIENLKDGWPTEARSLSSLLKEDVEGLEYSFPLEANGLRLSVHRPREPDSATMASATDSKGQSVDLPAVVQWPGWRFDHPENDPDTVTSTNKHDFVSEYTWWLIWRSVEPQWRAFLTGFNRVIDRHCLGMFPAAGLKSFVEGSSRLDIAELRKASRYEGYEAKSKYIQTFWRVVSAWPEKRQKQLLKFVTAAERIPIGGAGHLTFVVKKTVVEDLNYLPTSSTCFGTLYLPRYPNGEVLNEKLIRAIEYGLEGFGTG
ncbi:hypothetical protein B0A50_04222 [Salinomyces thailandicus]|uniref:HECT-type E3 ubiquitin transferase n=1 Tax=Salinomyces thailandicus TaxID=706561 RepID=A0A4U0TXP4_9PEZI|nr:hypothetical protein B0A50_04222 [Salinomyces thailandica]